LSKVLIDLQSSSSTDEAVTEGITLEGRVQKGLGPVFDAVLRDGDDLKVGSYIMGIDSFVNGRVRKLLNGETFFPRFYFIILVCLRKITP